MLIALLLTIIIEGLVMFILTRSWDWCKYNLYCNMLTNPLLNLALTGTAFLVRNSQSGFVKTGLGYYIPMFAGELAVLWGEMRIYELITRKERRECFRNSLITNGISALVGVIYSFFYYYL